jgi:hypothetical protein
MLTLAVNFETLPGQKPLEQKQIEVAFDQMELTLGELIESTVRAQLITKAIQENVKYSDYIDSDFLTEKMIATGKQQGRIALDKEPERRYSGKSTEEFRAYIRLEVAKALTAFSDKKFHVLIDGEMQQYLNEKISVNDSTKIVFLRLTALVGG